LVDTDIQSPGIHILFGLAEDRMSPALNDFLWGRCAIEAAAHDVSADAVRDAGGCVLLVPSSIKASHPARAAVARDAAASARAARGHQRYRPVLGGRRAARTVGE
jgi:MinD-like ATPase involved in chromosome partitioning or flagellar assembly